MTRGRPRLFRLLFTALRQIFQAAPLEAALLLLLLALGGLLPVVVLGLTRLLVDSLAAGLEGGVLTLASSGPSWAWPWPLPWTSCSPPGWPTYRGR